MPVKKIVFDADALNILSKNLTLLKESKADKIITPHLGEMSRLTGRPVTRIQQTLSETAAAFAIEYQTICVLKDARTVICAPDKTIYLNTTGNHGMATGGSGDVLAGLTAGFLQKLKMRCRQQHFLLSARGGRRCSSSAKRNV